MKHLEERILVVREERIKEAVDSTTAKTTDRNPLANNNTADFCFS